MARINFNDYQKVQDQMEDGNDIGFFNLKNHGDEAIVRIMHDSSDDFDIIGVHSIQMGNRYPNVECLRNPNDPVDVCPLCKSGAKFSYKFFVHMIQYTTDATGNVTAKPVVWERSAKQMGQKLVTMIQEYGPLSDMIFKIRRNGAAGDLKTTYEIMLANPNVYRPELYPRNDAAFANYNVAGRHVMAKSADDMITYLNTGSFPAKENNTSPAYDNNQPTQTQAPQAQVAQPQVVPPTYAQPPMNQTAAPVNGPVNRMPWESAPATNAPNTGAPATNRPVRYY